MDVQMSGLSMDFGDVKAVKDLTVNIKSGQMVSLLGPSGCGKSTTLMLLAGLFIPTGGEIYFGDKNVTQLAAEKRGIGMVFQNYALYPHLSVKKNILFPLKMLRVKKAEALERTINIAKMVKIEHLLDRKPGQLSGGQQQRVAIARALVKNPKLLLLDEPLSNLDARLRMEMREEIRRIQLEVGITAIFVTHDQEEAMSISDKIILMRDGVLQQESSPQDMYRTPVNIFAAEFIGSPPINKLEVTVSGESLCLSGMTRPLCVKSGFDEHKKVTAGIRPEHFYVTDDNTGVLTGIVSHIETIGRDTLMRVNADENTTVRVLSNAEISVKYGDKIWLGVKPQNIHLFDTETGMRLVH